jgi:hypothetical protein
MGEWIRLVARLARTSGLVFAVAWVARAWRPFYLESSGGGGWLDLAVLMVPVLMASGAIVLVVIGATAAVPAARSERVNERQQGRSARSSVGLGLLVSGLLVLTVISTSESEQRTQVLVGTTDDWPGADGELVAAGEIVAGVRIVQPLFADLFPTARLQRQSETLCIEIFVGTYLDRVNQGSIELAVSSSSRGREVSQRLDVASFPDNSWIGGCFASGARPILRSPDASLVVRGVDSPAGRAVTVWLRPATVEEPSARMSGTLSGATREDLILQHRVFVERRPPAPDAVDTYGAVLAALGVFVIAIDVMGLRLRGRRWGATRAERVH